MSSSDFSEDLVKFKAIKPKMHKPERYTEKRPWGSFDEFVENELCSVKIITVMPGESLSLQSHEHRSEWWVVLDEKMAIEINGKKDIAYRGEDVFVPQGSKHRVTGLDKPCRWLEITFGVFEEEDITRYEDKYHRK